MRIWLFRLLSLISVILFGVVGVNAQSDRLKVVVTYSILGDVVQNIAGDAVDLTVLVGADADTHSYEPVPQDSVAISQANIIFENGLGFESWMDDLYTAAASQAQRVVVSQGITAGTITVGDEAGETDPHIWQNPYNFLRVAELVRDTLVAADPANATTYELNANAYITQLLEADTYVIGQIQTIPADQRKLVTNHDAFGYFASRYGLEIIGTALGSVSTEGASGSAGNVVALVEAIRATGAKAIFPENIENADVVTQIANEAGVTVGAPLCSDALTPADGPCPTYLQLILYNADSVVAALGQ
ncbi:MAG: zinc ABC transporter substrate-binding protein [Chloroflexi bacterium]|nr:zinc ABC transporter substrate-binding protein [Chloroflexota bacterium]MCC6892643.1 zinc ABC transporter substrate-binding protein [Anaerolineae bacterium]